MTPSRLPCQRHLFDIPREVAYFNCGYMSPLLRASVEAGDQALRRKAHPWHLSPPDFFRWMDEARGAFAEVLGSTADDVALVPSVSYGLAVAARNLPLARGQRVVMLEEGFPSVIYTWRERAREVGAEVVMVPRPADDDWTSAVLAAIDDRTALAALPVCHWTDGALLDLAAIGDRLREVGATLAVDATQSLGIMPFDLVRVRPDFLAAAAYKWLLGPYSIGFLYVDPRWHGGRPIEHNWIAREGSEDFTALVRYRDQYQPGARRFDVGEPSNFALLPVAVVALRQLVAWGVPALYDTVSALARTVAERAEGFGLRAVPADRRAGHYLGLRAPGGLPEGLGGRLADAGVFVSVRGNALRVTPHVYNDEADLDRFFGALAGATGGRRGLA